MIKESLTSADADTLAYYDPTLPLTVACIASLVGTGAMISHTYPDGKAYVRKLHGQCREELLPDSKTGFGYSFVIQKFQQCLLQRNFNLHT